MRLRSIPPRYRIVEGPKSDIREARMGIIRNKFAELREAKKFLAEGLELGLPSYISRLEQEITACVNEFYLLFKEVPHHE